MKSAADSNTPFKTFTVHVTTKEQPQLTAAAIKHAFPRTSSGKISAIMSHGMGPAPMEKEAMYMYEPASKSQTAFAGSPDRF